MDSSLRQRSLPDIATEVKSSLASQLGWVGMAGIESPVSLAVEGGMAVQAPASVDAYVNLTRPEERGIHMSRLYLAVDEKLSEQALTPAIMVQLIQMFLESHTDLSDKAFVRIGFDYLVRRKALRSDLAGWRRYPVSVSAVGCDGQVRVQASVKITYSSTCPCSAALARRLIQEQFADDFDAQSVSFDAVHEWLGSQQGILATPHSQRSEADIDIAIRSDMDMFPLLDLIDSVEESLGTPVQTAVKRADEQAFALANGQNLMFCEDACRRIQHVLQQDSRYLDYRIRAAHLESLHPHDAVAQAVKGVPGGFRLD